MAQDLVRDSADLEQVLELRRQFDATAGFVTLAIFLAYTAFRERVRLCDSNDLASLGHSRKQPILALCDKPLLDVARSKRPLVALGVATIACAALISALWPSFIGLAVSCAQRPGTHWRIFVDDVPVGRTSRH
jgi:hypothetical protein